MRSTVGVYGLRLWSMELLDCLVRWVGGRKVVIKGHELSQRSVSVAEAGPGREYSNE